MENQHVVYCTLEDCGTIRIFQTNIPDNTNGPIKCSLRVILSALDGSIVMDNSAIIKNVTETEYNIGTDVILSHESLGPDKVLADNSIASHQECLKFLNKRKINATDVVENIIKPSDVLRPNRTVYFGFYRTFIRFMLKLQIDVAHHTPLLRRFLTEIGVVQANWFTDPNNRQRVIDIVRRYSEYIQIDTAVAGDHDVFTKCTIVSLKGLVDSERLDPLLSIDHDETGSMINKRIKVSNVTNTAESDQQQTEPDAIDMNPDFFLKLTEINSSSFIHVSNINLGSYDVYVRKTPDGLKFNDIVAYCTTYKLDQEIITRCLSAGLPPVTHWGGKKPIMICVEKEGKDGGTFRSYKVMDRGALRNVHITSSMQWHEIFLPGAPVTSLNIDIDLPACQRCVEKQNRKLYTEIGIALRDLIAYTLVRLTAAELTQGEIGCLAESLGRFDIYARSKAEDKISMRIVWGLPIELCAAEITHIRSFIQEIVEDSKIKNVLSFKDFANRHTNKIMRNCWVCKEIRILRDATDRDAKMSIIRSAIDPAPYTTKKSVRLPNFYKKKDKFAYISSINADMLTDPSECELGDAGLSTKPVTGHTVSIRRFGLDLSWYAAIASDTSSNRWRRSAEYGEPSLELITTVKNELENTWGVPIIVKPMTSGDAVILEATEQSTVPCPKHNRVHEKLRLAVILNVDGKRTPQCFGS